MMKSKGNPATFATMRAIYRFLLVSAVPLLMAACTSSAEPPETESDGPTRSGMIRGMTLDAVEKPSDEALAHLAEMGVDHITLIPFAFQAAHDDPALRFDPEPGWYSEGSEATRELAALGDSLGFDVIIKPQIWLGHDDGAWSANIGFDNEADWQAWEANYRTFILHHARIAAEIGSPVFVIGTELGIAVRERPEFWRALIAEIRAVYSGALTYASNWHEDYEHVAFWDALDYVGIQAYFPLADSDIANHSVAEFRTAWAPHKAALRQTAERTGKPILFTEIGYRSVHYAAAEPWRWPARGETTAADTTLQRQLYSAFFETFWEEDWFAGSIVWKWTIRPEKRRRRWMDGESIGFSVEGKPAEMVLEAWYGDRTFSGSDGHSSLPHNASRY